VYPYSLTVIKDVMSVPQAYRHFKLGLVALLALHVVGLAQAAIPNEAALPLARCLPSPSKAVTVYLTHQRICKACFVQLENAHQVRLRDAQGREGVYLLSEIALVDTHPWRRRFLENTALNINSHVADAVLQRYLHNGPCVGAN
jgi:hypothetical protein